LVGKLEDLKLEDIKLEDALNLLITAIALEKESLSSMLDAESRKMLYFLNECKLQKLSLQDIKDINQSVNKTIMNMIKLQMLLQFNLDNIMQVLLTTSISTTTSTTSTTSTTTTTTITVTTTNTTTSCTSTSTTTTSEKNKDKLIWRIPISATIKVSG
jgi:hypothetical protein